MPFAQCIRRVLAMAGLLVSIALPSSGFACNALSTLAGADGSNRPQRLVQAYQEMLLDIPGGATPHERLALLADPYAFPDQEPGRSAYRKIFKAMAEVDAKLDHAERAQVRNEIRELLVNNGRVQVEQETGRETARTQKVKIARPYGIVEGDASHVEEPIVLPDRQTLFDRRGLSLRLNEPFDGRVTRYGTTKGVWPHPKGDWALDLDTAPATWMTTGAVGSENSKTPPAFPKEALEAAGKGRVRFSEDGSRLLVEKGRTVLIFEQKEGSPVTIENVENVRGLSPDGSRFYGETDKKSYVIDLAAPSVRKPIEKPGISLGDFEESADGKTLFSSAFIDGRDGYWILAYDAKTGAELDRLKWDTNVRVLFGPMHTQLLGKFDGKTQRLDAYRFNGSMFIRFASGSWKQQLRNATLSADGKTLLVKFWLGGRNARLEAHDLDEWARLRNAGGAPE